MPDKVYVLVECKLNGEFVLVHSVYSSFDRAERERKFLSEVLSIFKFIIVERLIKD